MRAGLGITLIAVRFVRSRSRGVPVWNSPTRIRWACSLTRVTSRTVLPSPARWWRTCGAYVALRQAHFAATHSEADCPGNRHADSTDRFAAERLASRDVPCRAHFCAQSGECCS